MMTIATKITRHEKLRVIATLLLMSFSCCILLAGRIYLTHQLTYIFLVWNLFLALVPLWVAYKSYKVQQRYPGRYFLAAVDCRAMYDNTISASTGGKWVEVLSGK